MGTAILLVTWLIYGQHPSSYQTPFSSMETCQKARAAVLAENDRLQAEEDRRTAATRAQPGVLAYNPPIPPSVSAICAAQ